MDRRSELIEAAVAAGLRTLDPRLFVRLQRAMVGIPAPIAGPLTTWYLARSTPNTIIDEALLAEVFGDRTVPELRQLRSELQLRVVAVRILARLMRWGGSRARAAILDAAEARRLPQGPAVMVSWHVGVPNVLAPTLRRAGHDVLSIARAGTRSPRAAHVGEDESVEGHALVLLRCLEHLERGGKVLIAADGRQGDGGERVTVLGTTPTVRSGAAMLAHLAQAPIRPMQGLLERGRIRVRIGPPFALDYHQPRAQFIRDAAGAMATWIDALLRSRPELLNAVILKWMVES